MQEKEGNWISPEIARMDPDFKEEDLDHFQTRKDDVFIATLIAKY